MLPISLVAHSLESCYPSAMLDDAFVSIFGAHTQAKNPMNVRNVQKRSEQRLGCQAPYFLKFVKQDPLDRRLDQDLETRRTDFGFLGRAPPGIRQMRLMYNTDVCRIVRMVATACFLQEPQPGLVAQTTLSAGLSAVMFLAENVGPVALHSYALGYAAAAIQPTDPS